MTGTTLAAALLLWTPFSMMCELDSVSVNESSGIAASNHSPGVFYTHNDSGDGPRFFRFLKDGSVNATFTLTAGALDWEDMESAVVGGARYLYFGDIGDNARVRSKVTVYRCEEPLASMGSGALATTKYDFRYPDAPHNCEGMFVAPDGAIWLVTKESGPSKVFRGVPDASGTVTLEEKGSISINTGGLGGQLVTGASLSHDARIVVVRTYTGVRAYSATAGLDGWWASPAENVGNLIEIQGEAVCFSLDDGALLTSSEGVPCAVSISLRKNPRVIGRLNL
ncbi:MAG: hypothetical protein AB7F50_02625 [Fimbriimonadaceae bacterium]